MASSLEPTRAPEAGVRAEAAKVRVWPTVKFGRWWSSCKPSGVSSVEGNDLQINRYLGEIRNIALAVKEVLVRLWRFSGDSEGILTDASS